MSAATTTRPCPKRAGTSARPDAQRPRQRGFDRFFGILGGYGSLFNPFSMMLDDTPINAETPDFYFTDAVTDHALQMIEETPADQPFYLYLSYTAPHWPLHARDEDIAKYEGVYRGRLGLAPNGAP